MKSLIIGAAGQIGVELSKRLIEKYGVTEVVNADLNIDKLDSKNINIKINALDFDAVEKSIEQHQPKQVFMLAALLSAKSEENPLFAWDLNMKSLFNILELAKKHHFKVFWPSSIAVFGPDSPRDNTPQNTIMAPSTVYGISKLAGERWCEYYHLKYGVDVRSLRFPGLISYSAPPGGGTTDYAVKIFHDAIEGNEHQCFLRKDTALPMMYMDDAILAVEMLMEAPAERIKVRSSYNLSAFSFTPEEIFESIKTHFPGFTIKYQPDFRQNIADSWPNSIDDSNSFVDWNWKPNNTFEAMVEKMISGLSKTKVLIK
jgi:nucleoside-diphosphate-sugar epimerase